MTWLWLTLLSVLFVSIANILQRVLMKGDKSNPYSYAIIFHFLLGILNFICALFLGSHFSLFSGNIFMLLLASILWGATVVFLFKALQLVDVSEVTILSTIRVLVIIAASMIFLHESFGIVKIIGTVIIIVSTLLVTDLKKGITFNKGVLYTLLMALLGGLAIVTDSFNVKQYDPVFYNSIQNFLSGFCILLFYPKALKQWQHFVQPTFLKKMLPLGIFSTIQAIAYLVALVTPGVTAQVGTIKQSTVILTVILAIVFLPEKNNLLRKIIAAVLVTVGVFLLR